jgi:hypothetical protein
VIDPQAGQSLPRWKKSTALFGRSIEEGADILEALVAEMYRRNEILSNVEYIDENGHKVEGIEKFVPTDPIIRKLGLPLICLTVEEAGAQLTDDRSLQALITMATMARKCGIKLRVALQTVLLDQFQSSVLRQQLQSGNVVVFRTSDAITGNVAFNGVLPASPHLLPAEMPGACYVMSIGAKPVMSRTEPISDVYHWANVGETTPLPEVTAFLRAARMQQDAVDADVVGTPAARQAAPAVSKTQIARILEYVNDHHSPITTGTIAAALDIKLPTVSQSCRRLVERGQLLDHGDGLWARAETAEAKAEAAA